jgi:hypothetical protein
VCSLIAVENVVNLESASLERSEKMKSHRRSLLKDDNIEEYKKIVTPMIQDEFKERNNLRGQAYEYLGIDR